MVLPVQPLAWPAAATLVLLALRLPFLVARWHRGDLPGTRIILPAILLAEGLALFLPGSFPGLLQARLATALALEVLLLILAAHTLRHSRPGRWPEDRLAEAFAAFVPARPARLLALELVMLGSALGFLAGGFRRPAPPGFSHHREAALGAFLPALPLLIPGDFLLLGILAPRLAPWLRWLLHGSTIYAVLWLFGYYGTLRSRPHQVEGGEVRLHLGLLKSVAFPLARVQSVGPLPEFEDDWARHTHLRGVPQLVARGAPALELILSEPVRVMGLLGPGRPASRLVVSVDDPAAFAAALGVPCP